MKTIQEQYALASKLVKAMNNASILSKAKYKKLLAKQYKIADKLQKIKNNDSYINNRIYNICIP